MCAKAEQASRQRYGNSSSQVGMDQFGENLLKIQDNGAFSPAVNFAFLANVLCKIDKFYKDNANDTYLKITWMKGQFEIYSGSRFGFLFYSGFLTFIRGFDIYYSF